MTDKLKCECNNLKNGSIINTDNYGKCIICGKQYSKPPMTDKLKEHISKLLITNK